MSGQEFALSYTGCATCRGRGSTTNLQAKPWTENRGGRQAEIVAPCYTGRQLLHRLAERECSHVKPRGD